MDNADRAGQLQVEIEDLRRQLAAKETELTTIIPDEIEVISEYMSTTNVIHFLINIVSQIVVSQPTMINRIHLN